MKRRSMYMHTLDGKPAAYDADQNYMYFVGGRHTARLVSTLRQIRREQRAAIEECRRIGASQNEWANKNRYGYVLVDVPGMKEMLEQVLVVERSS